MSPPFVIGVRVAAIANSPIEKIGDKVALGWHLNTLCR